MPFFFNLSGQQTLLFVTTNEGIRLFNVWLIMTAREKEIELYMSATKKPHDEPRDEEAGWKSLWELYFLRNHDVLIWYGWQKNQKHMAGNTLFTRTLSRRPWREWDEA